MAAKTTVKVATLSASAKDDALAITTIGGLLPVLANDPGSATLYGVYQSAGTWANGLTPTSQVSKTTSASTANGGTVTINANGTLSYTPPVSAGLNQAALTALPAGVVYYTDSFAYVAKMGIDGSLSLARVSFAIVGVNDLPTINGLSTGGATENGPAATGTLVVVDPDTGQSSMTASTQTGGWGTLNMGTDGSWSYTLGATQDALNAGQTETETFTVNSADGTAHTITITVNGINDVPVADDASADASEGGAVITGNVTSSDLDATHTATYALPDTAPAGLTFNADGSWSFDPTDGAYDSLAEGETQLVEVPYTVTDDQNTSDTGELVITVTGTNDAPVAEAASASVDEDSSTSGTVSATDVDNGADLSFSSDSDADGFDMDSDGSWTFDASGEDYQSLAVGDTMDVEVDYTVSDEEGGTDT
ncbi:MAG: VCBS domain-containing protein, partial [Ramlibacter sp.]